MSGVVLTVVTVVVTEVVTMMVVVTVVAVWYNVVQLPPPLRVSADVLNTPPLVRQSDQQQQHVKLVKHFRSSQSFSGDKVSNPLAVEV